MVHLSQALKVQQAYLTLWPRGYNLIVHRHVTLHIRRHGRSKPGVYIIHQDSHLSQGQATPLVSI